MSTDEYDSSAHAAAANRFGATAYLGFQARSDMCSELAYFYVPSFESVGGRALASLVAQKLEGLLPATPELHGMRLPVLRETRMPAILCSLGPVRDVVDVSGDVADAVVEAVSAWSNTPIDITDS